LTCSLDSVMPSTATSDPSFCTAIHARGATVRLIYRHDYKAPHDMLALEIVPRVKQA
jgi:hypothetical protein